MRGRPPKRKQGAEPAKTPLYSREAKQVVELHEKIVARDRDSLGDAIAAGRVLCKVKEGLPHGQFQKWCEAHVHNVCARMIRYYMQIYRTSNAGKLRNVETLSEAIQRVCQRKATGATEPDKPTTELTATPSSKNEAEPAADSQDQEPDSGQARAALPAASKVSADKWGPRETKSAINRTTKADSSIVAEVTDECVVLEISFRDVGDLKSIILEAFDSYGDELSTKGRFLIAGKAQHSKEPKTSASDLLDQTAGRSL